MKESMYQTKTQQLVNKFNSGDTKSAIKILASFRIGITKEQKRVLEIVKDCNSGRENFYEKLGVDTKNMKREALTILNNYINKYLWRMN